MERAIHVFLFNHNSEFDSNQSANSTLYVCDMAKNGVNDYCNVTEFLIDDTHSQFWNIYWNDVILNNITSFCPTKVRVYV